MGSGKASIMARWREEDGPNWRVLLVLGPGMSAPAIFAASSGEEGEDGDDDDDDGEVEDMRE